MKDWNADYVTDLAYTFGYFNELNPLQMRWLLLYSGLAAPRPQAACELGFGQGLAINIHSATSACQWYGTDYNPEQVAFALDMARLCEHRAALYDDSFAELAQRPDLPDFDFMAMHGIWSWVSEENRQILKQFIARKLKPGGVLYVSYNCYPGYGIMGPLRHLMLEYARAQVPAGAPMPERVNSALDFLDRVLATDPAYARDQPQTAARLRYLSMQERSYLAHEYFNTNWKPFHFSAMQEEMQEAGLTYGCSATISDHVQDLNFTPGQQAYLRSIADPVLAQTTADFLSSRQFRRDYWVRSPRRLDAAEREQELRRLSCVLVAWHEDFPYSAQGMQGQADLKKEIYGPVLQALSDYRMHSIDQLARRLAPAGLSFEQLLRCLMVLNSTHYLRMAQLSPQDTDHARLNAYILERARTENDIAVLASPLLGGAVDATRCEQLFLLALQEDRHSGPEQWADFVWQQLTACGQNMLLEGRALQGEAEHKTALRQMACAFQRKTLPIWQNLRIAPARP